MTKEVQTETNTEVVQPQLTLADIVSALQIINAATTRGAFKANELSTVGGVYDRISAYVEFIQPKEGAEGAENGAAAE